MNASMKFFFMFILALTLIIVTGCAPTFVDISTPKIQTIENSFYSVQFEPLSEGKNFFDGFRLSITNKMANDLQIDWNKTSYLYNGRSLGPFVFEGIQPKDIRNLTVPPSIIAGGQSFSKKITPFKLLAREPITGRSKQGSMITSGIIPKGQNGIFLFIIQNGNQIKEKMTVNITERAIQ